MRGCVILKAKIYAKAGIYSWVIFETRNIDHISKSWRNAKAVSYSKPALDTSKS